MATLPGPPGLSDAVQPNPLVTAFPARDSFFIANLGMPGKWTLTEATKEFGWQIQQGFGLSGAVVFPKGDPLVTAKFKGEFWAQSDVALYKEIRKRLLDKGTITLGILTSAMGIRHPELEALGVTDVVVLKNYPLIQEDGGLWVTHVDFLQYRKPNIAAAKPTQTVPSAAAPTPTAVGAQDIEIQKLTATVAAAKGA